MDANDQGMYEDAPEPNSQPAAGQPDKAEASDRPSGVLSKEAFGGKKINAGDTCSFRVLRVNEKDVEVQYVSESGSDEDEMGEMME